MPAARAIRYNLFAEAYNYFESKICKKDFHYYPYPKMRWFNGMKRPQLKQNTLTDAFYVDGLHHR